MKVATVVGARPEFVQLAPVSRALRQHCQECMIHTGQHYDYAMSAQFFEELALPQPAYHLNCGSGSHGAQTGRMLEAIEQVLQRERPDWVVVFGDTNSTLAAALAAVKLHLPVAHIEAGLRSFNRAMPEEINRVVVDHISARLFCPTRSAQAQLAGEGIVSAVELVGDVMYDIQLQMEPALDARVEGLLGALEIQPQGYVLVTVHRPANTDDRDALRRIAEALNRLSMPIIFPVHPRTRARFAEYQITLDKHIQVIPPVGYLDMLTLERSASCILTDSGGVQKQAFFFHVPCVTMRTETEWIETVQAGWNVLVGSDVAAILAAVHRSLPAFPRENPFGNGNAAGLIVQSLTQK
jgi:UDP-GlcNAc3NAcA epimerase